MTAGNFADRRHLGRSAGEEDFACLVQVFQGDIALDNLDAFVLGQGNHSAPGDAVQEAAGYGGVQLAVLNQEHIRAGRLGYQAAVVQNQGILIALSLGIVLRQRADHVKACCLGLGWCAVRCRTAPRCQG